ncbi:hypothetical protein BaOVIS_023610 [Babesia ovis]|uniref:Uncharacterized protein n=1 Tax=Babesia ovis TaxID=5869 RepID=A0A9W5WW33_BABOV|nr:hypothetical protein BaOVIS_023610 [Babesia ovis]
MAQGRGQELGHSGQRRKKQVARESLCALLCDDPALQKSAALTLAKAATADGTALEVLLSLIRGEVPNCMPSYSVSKSIFLPNEIWLEGSRQIAAVKADFGVNTLRECLQGPEAWERARIIALKALLVTYQKEQKPLDDILPHILVGLKQNSETHLTYCRDTALALALEFAEAIPDGDGFEYAVLQMALNNEDIKMPLLRSVIVRGLRQHSLLPRIKNLMQRMLDNEASSPLFDELGDVPQAPVLASFGIAHFCSLNLQSLTSAIPCALHLIGRHAANSPKLSVLWLLVLALRLREIDAKSTRGSCINYMQSMLDNGATVFIDEVTGIVHNRSNVIRVLLDALVTAAYDANRKSHPLYGLVKLIKSVVELMINVTSADSGLGVLSPESMDVASLLKVRAMVLHLSDCGAEDENNGLYSLLESIKTTVSDDGIDVYARQFDLSQEVVLEEYHIWQDLEYLVEGTACATLIVVKSRIDSATDIVWAYNTVQRFYVDVGILGNVSSVTAKPNIHGTVVHLRQSWSLRDAINVSLMTLVPNVTVHATAHAYIWAMGTRNNEQALFFVSPLVESTLVLMKQCLVVSWDIGLQMIERNIVLLARLGRHKLALPIVYSAFKYIFNHEVTHRLCGGGETLDTLTKCSDKLLCFQMLDATWRCLLLKYSDIPSSKVFTSTLNDLEAMTTKDKLVYIKVFRSLSKYRPEDAVKHVNLLGPIFAEYPAYAVDCCTRMCANDVMDFGVAYRVYVEPIFQRWCTSKDVVTSIGQFFAEYLQRIVDTIEGQITDEDVVDLNLILPMLLKLLALNCVHGATAIAKLLKSSLWTKIEKLRIWHLNKECDCNSLLDRINKKQLRCTFAKLDQEFFEFNFRIFIANDSSNQTDDLEYTQAVGLLISGLLDAENDATSRVELLSRRNETVLEYNREIRRVTRELLQLLGNSKPSVSSFRWFLEEDETDTRGRRQLSAVEATVPPMQGAEMGLGSIRVFHLGALLTLYGMKIDGKGINRDAVCENAYSSIMSSSGNLGGNLLINLAALANVVTKHSLDIVKHMMQYLCEVKLSLDLLTTEMENINYDKAVVYAWSLCHLYCKHNEVVDFPKMVLGLLRSGLQKYNHCIDLVEVLFIVMGNIYKYGNLESNCTIDIVNLFFEYLDVICERTVGLGWVIGLANIIHDLPRLQIGALMCLVNRVVSIVERREVEVGRRALISLPLLQYWTITKCHKVGSSLVHLLMEAETIAEFNARALLFVVYCNYMGFNLETVTMSATMINLSGGCITVDGSSEVTHGNMDGRTSVVERGVTCCIHKIGIHSDDENAYIGTYSDSKDTRADGDRVQNNLLLHEKQQMHASEDANIIGENMKKLHETVMACIKSNMSSDNETKEMLLIGTILAHGFEYLFPPRTVWYKYLLRHKRGWSVLYKDMMVALSSIAREEAVTVTMATGVRVSRYSRSRPPTTVVPQTASTQGKDNGNTWGDETTAMVSILQLENIKKFLARHSDLDCYREDGSISAIASALKEDGHSMKLLSALTFCKPLKLTLWDIIEYDDARCNCERELIMRIYCLHGQVNTLLERMPEVAKYFKSFDRKLKLSFLSCVCLAFWSIDFNSLRIIMAYIVDYDDIDVILTIGTLLESCTYLLKGGRGTGRNDEDFAAEVLSKLLYPVVVHVISQSTQCKAALWLYRKILPLLNEWQQADLSRAIDNSDITVKCTLAGICSNGQAPFTFNECFAHLVTQNLEMRDVVLYAFVNIHRHVEVIQHCIHVLNVNANTERITLVALTLMALIAERNVTAYLLELLYDGTQPPAQKEGEVAPLITLDIYEFLRLSRQPNILYYDTIDGTILSKSANVVAKAPCMWSNCGLETTVLGNLQPVAQGRCVPSWLPKLGDAAIDRRRQSLLPIGLPERHYCVDISDSGARSLLSDNANVIMRAYKAYLVDHHQWQPALRDIMAYLNSRLS